MKKREVLKTFMLLGMAVSLIGVTEAYYEIQDIRNSNKVVKVQVRDTQPSTYIAEAQGKDTLEEEVVEVLEKKTIALLGSDTRVEGEIGRSDAIIVMQFDPENSKVNYVSVPRDSYVDIARKGYKDKINHAMAYGVDYSVETLENLFEVDIDNYFMIDFHSFERIVDKLGGVEVEVSKGFYEQNKSNKKRAVYVPEGYQTLTGEQALAYARMRKQDNEGDIGRAKRQQQIVDAVLTKLGESTTYEKISIAKEILLEVETDLELKSIVSYIDYLQQYETINKLVLTGKGMSIGGVYYMDITETLEQTKQTLQDSNKID